jgi:hypothetical protein
MIGFDAYIALANGVTLAAGGFVTVLAVRAYVRTNSPALRALATGLGLVTVGAFLGGAVHWLTGWGLPAAIAVQSTATAVGVSVLAYSLYVAGADEGAGADVRPGRST